MSTYEMHYSDEIIKYTVERSKRKTLELSVLPDMSVHVVAPEEASIEKIQETLIKRAFWILKQREYFTQFVPKEPPRQYISGETHRYLGRQYRLKIVESKERIVKLEGKYLYVFTDKTNYRSHHKRLLYSWYKKHANDVLKSTVEKCLKKIEKYGINNPELIIKIMKSRWGSCDSEKKRIIINTELIKTPSHCIEYVVMHELCHLKYPNHDNNFYKFLTLVMPDWKERKLRLEKSFQ